MRSHYILSLLLICSSCNTENGKPVKTTAASQEKGNASRGAHFEGTVSNGMKGDKISFDVSADGKRIENLTFTGYWRCDGKLESVTAGPEGSFDIVNNKVSGHISEPPNGGSTAWRFELEASIDGKEADGNFRMNINNLGCDTYKLKWTASAN